MNKERRKELKAIVDQISSLNLELVDLCEEEQSYFDNMPEGLQSSERGEASDDAISQMDDAMGALEEARDYLEEAHA